jgi:hypothetical protein
MIEVIEGRGVGAGKSYFAVDRLMPHWVQGGTAFVSDTVVIHWEECKRYAKQRAGVVLEDDQFRAISSVDLQHLHEVTLPGSVELPVLIVVDEAQDAFNARDWSDKSKRPFFSWLCQSRHDDNDVVILSQAAANVDKQVRRLCTYIWIVRNTEYFPVGGKPLSKWIRLFSFGLSNGRYFVRTQLDQDGKTVLGKRWVKADRGLFRCYESKAMRLRHKRAGSAVARKKLEVVRGRKPMMKWVVLLLLVLVGWSGCRGVQMWLGTGKKSHRSEAVAVVGVRAGYVNGEIVPDVLRASAPGYLQTASHGAFVAGEWHALGFVEYVDGRAAWVRVSKLVRIKVEAKPGDWRAPEAAKK